MDTTYAILRHRHWTSHQFACQLLRVGAIQAMRLRDAHDHIVDSQFVASCAGHAIVMAIVGHRMAHGHVAAAAHVH